MARRIEDIFNSCLERINQGESIENCLKDYPEIAQELGQLLRTSLNISWRSSLVKPRPEFKTKARAQFIRTLTEQNLATHYEAMKQRYGKRTSIFGLHRILAPALTTLAVIIIIGGAGTATAAAATGAMPDHTLYPVKLATEQVRLALAFSDEGRAILNAEIAETRSKEIQAMANEGDTEQIILAAERMYINLENTALAVSRIVQEQDNLIALAPAAPGMTPLPPPVTEPDMEQQPDAGGTLPSAVTPKPDVEEEPVTPDETLNGLARTSEPPTQLDGKSPADNEGDIQRPAQLSDATKSKNAKLKKKLESSMDGNLSQLELALAKAPENAKPYILNAMEIIKNNRKKISETLPDNGYYEENKNGGKVSESSKETTGNSGNITESDKGDEKIADDDSKPEKGNNPGEKSNRWDREDED